MKKREDVGLEYIKRLGVRGCRDNRAVYNSLVDAYGKKQADEIAKMLEVAEKMESLNVFPTVEENLKLIKLYIGGIEADKFRALANFLDNNVGMIGQKILVVGAGYGLMLPFLSDKFSDATLYVLDSKTQKQAIAEEVVKEFELNNIEFISENLEDIEKESFDAVIVKDSIYGLMENELYDAKFKMLYEQVESYDKCLQYAADLISSKIKPYGFLVVMEEHEPTPDALGLLYALNSVNCGIVTSTYNSIEYKLLDRKGSLQCFAAQKGGQADKLDIDNLWSESLHISSNDNEFTETQAELMLENFHGEVIEGYFLVDKFFEKQSKFAIYECRQNKDLILYYFNMFDSSYLGFYSKDIINEIKSDMNDRVSTFEKTGCTKKAFKLVGNQELIQIEKGDLSLKK